MAISRIPRARRRQPLSVLVAPETLVFLREIAAIPNTRWSLGKILDSSIRLSAEALKEEAAGREVIVLLSDRHRDQLQHDGTLAS